MKKPFNELKSGEVFKSLNPELKGKQGFCIAVKSISGKADTIAYCWDDIVDRYGANHCFFWDKEVEVVGKMDVSKYQKIHRVSDMELAENV